MCVCSLPTVFPGVQFLDVGCAYGGGVVCIAQEFPDKVVLGLEIRAKVAEYALYRIQKLREGSPDEYTQTMVPPPLSLSSCCSLVAVVVFSCALACGPAQLERLGRADRVAQGPFPPYENCSVMRSNAMRYLPYYFHKGQLEKVRICLSSLSPSHSLGA